ncbi:MAG: dihydropteroate synthase [Bacteroidales bacterium]|nr:dihydropteroate synthase [Bacteroidales bacterium]
MNDKDTFFSKKNTLRLRGKITELSDPKIMGVLNVTPDSFYDGGRYTNKQLIIKKVSQMITEGADMIDVGAFSSRPGAVPIPENDEIKRLEPALDEIRTNYPDIPISVDTFRAGVAKYVVKQYDVNIINDIFAGTADDNMYKTIADLGVPYIIMHMKGTPQNMQKNPVYDNLMKEIILFFSERLRHIRHSGIHDIIIDPGFGFGKTIEHNYTILRQLDAFKIFELPVMVGLSRKSFIYKVLKTVPEESLNGTTVLNTIALINGASILRVHDVKEAKEAIRLTQMYLYPTNG